MTTINYTWHISGLGGIQTENLGMVITNVYYTYQGQSLADDSSNYTWEHGIAGTANLSEPNSTFIPLQDLDVELVKSWIQNILGSDTITAMTSIIEKSIESQKQAHLKNIEWQSLPWEQK